MKRTLKNLPWLLVATSLLACQGTSPTRPASNWHKANPPLYSDAAIKEFNRRYHEIYALLFYLTVENTECDGILLVDENPSFEFVLEFFAEEGIIYYAGQGMYFYADR